MTKYRIKLRRTSLTRGQIERHKDFGSLYSEAGEEEGSFPVLRFVAIGMGILLIALMVGLGIRRVIENKKEIERQKATEYYDEV